MPFDVAGARAAGYSDDDILQEFQRAFPAFNSRGAFEAGYTLEQISQELDRAPEPPAPESAPPTPEFTFPEIEAPVPQPMVAGTVAQPPIGVPPVVPGPAPTPQAMFEAPQEPAVPIEEMVFPEIEPTVAETTAMPVEPAPVQAVEEIKPTSVFQQLTAPVSEEVVAQDRNFFERVGESWNRGDVNAMLDIMAYDAMTGKVPWKEVETLIRNFEERAAKDPVEAGNFFTQSVMGLSGMLPAMFRGIAEAQKMGLAGAGGGAVAAAIGGQVGPQIALPEEAVTVPVAAGVGYAVGSTFGSTEYWRRQGAGSMYRSLKERGTSDETATIIAQIAGIPYALIEQSQVSRAIPGADKALQNIVTKSLMKTLLKAGTKYAWEVGEQGFEEAVQGAIDQTTLEVAKYIDGEIKSGDLDESALRIAQRALSDFKESFGPLALLMLPKAARRGASALVETAERKAMEPPEAPGVEPGPEGPMPPLAPEDIDELRRRVQGEPEVPPTTGAAPVGIVPPAEPTLVAPEPPAPPARREVEPGATVAEIEFDEFQDMPAEQQAEVFKSSRDELELNSSTKRPGLRPFNRELKRRTQGYQQPVYVAVGDINGYKRYNDDYLGMEATDLYNAGLYDRISGHVGRENTFNIHGDEYMVFGSSPEELQSNLRAAMDEIAQNPLTAEQTKTGEQIKTTFTWMITQASDSETIGNVDLKSLPKNTIGFDKTTLEGYNNIRGSDLVSDEEVVKRKEEYGPPVPAGIPGGVEEKEPTPPPTPKEPAPEPAPTPEPAAPPAAEPPVTPAGEEIVSPPAPEVLPPAAPPAPEVPPPAEPKIADVAVLGQGFIHNNRSYRLEGIEPAAGMPGRYDFRFTDRTGKRPIERVELAATPEDIERRMGIRVSSDLLPTEEKPPKPAPAPEEPPAPPAPPAPEAIPVNTRFTAPDGNDYEVLSVFPSKEEGKYDFGLTKWTPEGKVVKTRARALTPAEFEERFGAPMAEGAITAAEKRRKKIREPKKPEPPPPEVEEAERELEVPREEEPPGEPPGVVPRAEEEKPTEPVLREPGEPGEEGVRRVGREREPADRSERGGVLGAPDVSESGGGTSDRTGAEKPRGPQTRRNARTDDRNDYRIVSDDRIGSGGLTAKYGDNMEAIRLLKRLETDGRRANPDEQRTLVRYVGWGGLSQAFKETDPRNAELRDLLTKEEYDAARRSTINAHYTSPDVISAIWDGVRRLGFRGGAVMEPAAGVGHFYGLRPDDIKMAMHGVELDSISGRIARQLYQGADIKVQGYQDYKMRPAYFDLAISNVPFSEVKPREPKAARTPGIEPGKYSLHDFYFLKTLAGMKDKGVVAFVTSRYTMDKKDSGIRRKIADQADVVGAIRLPDTAFKKNANTEVVTDIIFLQKRPTGQERSDLTRRFVETQDIQVGENAYPINAYYHDHPEMVIGQHAATGTMYQADAYNVEMPAGEGYEDLIRRLRDAMNLLPENVMEGIVRNETKRVQAGTDEHFESKLSPQNLPLGGYQLEPESGDLVQRDAETEKIVKVHAPPAAINRLKGMVRIRNAARTLFSSGFDPNSPKGKALVSNLNKAYDAFVKRYGPLHLRQNAAAYAEDPDVSLLMSLENWDAESKTATKTDVFKGLTFAKPKEVDRADNDTDAIIVSLTKYGRLDIPFAARLRGMTDDDFITSIVNSRAAFEDATHYLSNPDNDPAYLLADEYLSGNVRAKLEVAQEAAQRDKRFAKNVEALKAVVPKDLGPTEVSIKLNTPILEEQDIATFTNQLLGTRHIEAIHIPALGKWELTGRGFGAKAFQTYGTGRMSAVNIVESMLNGKAPRVYDRTAEDKLVLNEEETALAVEKSELIKQEFQGWLWADQDRATRLLRTYNDRFNSVVPRTYTHPLRMKDPDAEVRFPGSAFPYPMRPHQADAVWRQVQNKRNMLAHVVGSGKTLEMITGAMELRRLGLRRKPMIVVPNHMLRQWANDFYAAYPNAKVLIPSEKEFKESRRVFMNRVATGDWDCVIVKHSQFKMLPISKDRQMLFYQRKMEEYESILRDMDSKRQKGRTVKQIEKAKDKFEEKLKALADTPKDVGVIPFDEMGVDHLMVDEADEFKNLSYYTQLQNVRGMGQQQGSQRAFDMLMKVEYVQEVDGGLTFATGTPISNTLVEAYHMMKYLQPETLRSLGIEAFDEWQRMFAETVTSLEQNNTGTGYKNVTRFSRIVNLPELMNLLREVWDIRTARMLEEDGILVPGKNLPYSKIQNLAAPATPTMKSYLRWLEVREKEAKEDKESRDNTLTIIGDGKLAAVDLRIINPALPDDAASKLNTTVELIKEKYDQYKKERYLTVVFYDSTRPDPDRAFDVHTDMKRKLVEMGVKENEIAFIHDANTDVRKQALFDAANAGRIRVLFGSTKLMGAGTNIQKKLKTLIHMDAPWRPRDIEQRNGRGIRQGNTTGEIEVYNMVTKGSLDTGLWNTLNTKAKAIEAIMSGRDPGMREVEEDYYESVRNLSIDDPLMKESVDLHEQIKKLELSQRAHTLQASQAKAKAARLPGEIAETERQIRQREADVAKRAPKPTGDKFTITIKGKVYGSYKDAGLAIRKEIDRGLVLAKASPSESYADEAFGEFANFPLRMYTHAEAAAPGEVAYWHRPTISTQGNMRYGNPTSWPNPDPVGIVRGLVNATYDGMDTELENARARLVERQESLKESKILAVQEFAKAEELDAVRKRRSEILKQIQERPTPVEEEVGINWRTSDLRWVDRMNATIIDEKEALAAIEEEAEVETTPTPTPGVKAAEVVSMSEPEGKDDRQTTQVDTPALAKSAKKGKRRAVESGNEIARATSWNPGGPKKGSGYLTMPESIYFQAKEIAYPLIKMRKILEKAGVAAKGELMDKIDYAVNRVRGAASIAGQHMKDHYEPIFAPLKEFGPKKRGEVARLLSRYLIAKRSDWLYKNKVGYVDAGISEEAAEQFMAHIEEGENEHSDLVMRMAGKIWAYNKGLVEIKHVHGVIDDQMLVNLKEPFYVPFFRDIDESYRKGIQVPRGIRFTATSTGIKRIKGSENGHKIIDPLQLIIAQTTETIVNAYRADVAQNVVELAEANPEIFGELISKLPPRWRKAGKIEHRTEIDAQLSPKIKEWASKLGYTQKYKARMGKRLGAFDQEKGEIRIMFGATEGTKAHELGHLISETTQEIKFLLAREDFAEEMSAVANSRYEGEEVPLRFINYVNQADEKQAEFISMYVTDRPALEKIAPKTLSAFEDAIARIPKLKGFSSLKPSNIKEIEKWNETNWVMDNSVPPDEDVISMRREGKLVHYRVPIEMAQAIKNLHPQQLPTWLRWTLAVPTRALRFGAVSGNVDFIVPNVTRDQVDAAFNAKTIPVWDWFIGLKHFIAQDDVYRLYMLRGGGMDSPEAGTRALQRGAAQMIYGSKAGEFLDPFYWKDRGVLSGTGDLLMYGIKTPFRPVIYMAEASEMGTRLGIFARGMKAGDMDAAVHAARQSTLDFQRFGYHGRTPNEVIPFLNAALEGIDRFARTWKEQPVRAMMYSGLLYLLYLGLYGWNKLNKHYKDISSREKGNNWIIMKNREDADYWKVPKGHITKLILNPMQMIVETVEKQSRSTGWDIAVQMYQDVSPVDVSSVTPITLKLIVEPIANYDLYWREQIERPTIHWLPPGQRFNKRTSETLKTIGNALNISPAMMQHEVKTLFGGTGRSVLWITDYVLGLANVQKPPDITLDRAVVVRRFVGKAEEWKSDTETRIRDLEKRRREIEMKLGAGPAALAKYYGYRESEIKRANDAAQRELKLIGAKVGELRTARLESQKLIEQAKGK